MKQTEKKFVIAVALLVILLSSSYMVLINLDSSNHRLKIRVACVGDSITEGTEYSGDLQKLLGPNYDVGNFGAGGSTVLLSSDKPYALRPVFQKAIDFRPDIIVLMLGTNDANPKYYGDIQNFVADYKRLILLLQNNGGKVWLVFPPPIFNDSLGPKSTNLVQGVIPRIEQVAEELNLPTINVYPLLLNHSDYFWDGVHPDYRGAGIIAAEVFRVVFASRIFIRPYNNFGF